MNKPVIGCPVPPDVVIQLCLWCTVEPLLDFLSVPSLLAASATLCEIT